MLSESADYVGGWGGRHWLARGWGSPRNAKQGTDSKKLASLPGVLRVALPAKGLVTPLSPITLSYSVVTIPTLSQEQGRKDQVDLQTYTLKDSFSLTGHMRA